MEDYGAAEVDTGTQEDYYAQGPKKNVKFTNEDYSEPERQDSAIEMYRQMKQQTKEDDFQRSKSVDRSTFRKQAGASGGLVFPSQIGNESDNGQETQRATSAMSYDPQAEKALLKRKSAAHHKMFDQSTAPWGVERAQGIVPQMKRIDPDNLPAAGIKTFHKDKPAADGGALSSIQDLQAELSN